MRDCPDENDTEDTGSVTVLYGHWGVFAPLRSAMYLECRTL